MKSLNNTPSKHLTPVLFSSSNKMAIGQLITIDHWVKSILTNTRSGFIPVLIFQHGCISSKNTSTLHVLQPLDQALVCVHHMQGVALVTS